MRKIIQMQESAQQTLLEEEKIQAESQFAHDVFTGLQKKQKSIPSLYFYDQRGSELFEDICTLPEYYPTRTETEILQTCSADIAGLFGNQVQIIELGSGSSLKTRLLLEAFLQKNGSAIYKPIDVSETILNESAQSLSQIYENLQIQPLAARYEEGLQKSISKNGISNLILWLGSSIGNFTREEAVYFLKSVRELSSSNSYLLIGIDLRKEKALLERAYDDAQGVTAAFNLNLLERMNRELLADFDLSAFRHLSKYDEEKGRVEMNLVSQKKQTVHFGAPGFTVQFEAGESIHTENSYKYAMEEIEDLASQTGLILKQQWLDPKKWSSLNLFIPK